VFNFRDELAEQHNEDLVRIKSCGAIFKNLHNDSRVSLPDKIRRNIASRDVDLRKETGKIIQIFIHPVLANKPHIYVVKLETSKAKGKYILIGKTGIKKLGNVTVGVNE